MHIINCTIVIINLTWVSGISYLLLMPMCSLLAMVHFTQFAFQIDKFMLYKNV